MELYKGNSFDLDHKFPNFYRLSLPLQEKKNSMPRNSMKYSIYIIVNYVV